MSRFFVAGLINMETTLAVDSFPIPYSPVNFPFFGIQTTVSGVGYNVAKALTTLGNQVDFASLVGREDNGLLVYRALKADGIGDELVLDALAETAQSVILYDPVGKRQIHTDLKDIQDQVYPLERAVDALKAADLAVICNVNFARPLLTVAKALGKPIATDVHALRSLDDDYNQDFMAAANILFLSNESLDDTPQQVIRRILKQFDSQIVVIGLGAEGAMMGVRRDGFVGHFPAVRTRDVVNSIGAGDALFSAFLDRFQRLHDPYTALRQAMVFASYKIGEKGAAQGFLTAAALDEWIEKAKKQE